MKTADELFTELFLNRMDKNLDIYLEENKEFLKNNGVLSKKKWEPNKAPDLLCASRIKTR